LGVPSGCSSSTPAPAPGPGLAELPARDRATPHSYQKERHRPRRLLDHIPLRYLLAFTAVVIATSRDYLAAAGASPEQVDRMHAAFTKSVMLHVTVWTRPYVDAADW
jgi:hypothetical protein